jgi:hypothetical protein
MLALNEGFSVSLDAFHKDVWMPVGVLEKAQTKEEINHIIQQVEEAGRGFMWISCNADESYTFHTRWGHNWKGQKLKSAPPKEVKLPSAKIKKRKPAGKTIGKLAGAAGLIAASMIIAFSPLFNTPAQDEYFDIDDFNIPLAVFELDDDECECDDEAGLCTEDY